MTSAGVEPDHAERALGHVIAGVRGVYDRAGYRDEKRRALEGFMGLLSHRGSQSASKIFLGPLGHLTTAQMTATDNLSRAAHQTIYNVAFAFRLRPLKELVPDCIKSVGLRFKLVHVIAASRLVEIPIGNGIQNRLRHSTI